ncbi:MAG TPA: hypothetical protein VFR37_14580 [Longimicrobium sp.]|nr:hypothetical protein [Longimicrobium sp.]
MRNSRIQALGLAALLLAAACDDLTTVPAAANAPVVGEGEKVLGTVTCHVDMVAETTRCGEPAPLGASATRVTLNTSQFGLVISPSFYDAANQRQHYFTGIRNDIGQRIGTHNGINSDSTRAFVTNITVTGGSGSVTVNNPTGYKTHTAPNQPYWEYYEVVEPTETTGATPDWIFNVPSTVTSWTYTVSVSTPVQHPNGWVAVTGNTSIPHSGTQNHVAVVYDWTGAVVNSGSVSWSSSDGSGSVYVSPWDERNGTVLGVRIGTATVTASFGSATPKVYGVTVS